MYKVMKRFYESSNRYRTYKCDGGDANLELVDKFCYLGDMLSVDGDADAAVETTIRIGWNKYSQLVPLLTNKLLIVRARLGDFTFWISLWLRLKTETKH